MQASFPAMRECMASICLGNLFGNLTLGACHSEQWMSIDPPPPGVCAYAPLPFALAHLGWPAGILFLGLAGLCCLVHLKSILAPSDEISCACSVCTAALCLCASGMAGRHHLPGPGRDGDLVHFAAAGEPGQA